MSIAERIAAKASVPSQKKLTVRRRPAVPAWQRPPSRIPRCGPAGLALDTETTGLRVWHGDGPYAVSIVNEWGEYGYYEWPVDPFTRVVIYDEADVRELRDAAADTSLSWVFHNGKFDRRVLLNECGVEFRGPLHDTQWAAHTCNSNEMTYALKPLADKYWGINKDDINELHKWTIKARKHGDKLGWLLAGDKEGQLDVGGKSPVPPDYWMVSQAFPEHRNLLARYACFDVERTMGLWFLYRQLMDEEPDLWETYELERSLAPVIWKMEGRGIRLDVGRCTAERDACLAERDEALAVLRAAAGPDFQPTNDNQIRKWLYEERGLPVKHRTDPSKKHPHGQPSVSQPALMDHLDDPAVQALFKYNIADKGATAFFGSYLHLRSRDTLSDDGGFCLHANFKHVDTKTARLACTTPNLQNVPDAISTRAARPIQGRVPFGPRPGYWWYHADYSQLEVRIFADVSQEPTLLRALATGRDIHTECANKAWGGHGNASGIRNAINALRLDGVNVGSKSDEERDTLDAAFARLDITRERLRAGFTPEERAAIADRWLALFDYDIVEAEKSIGKKNTRAKAKMVLFARMFGGGPGAVNDLMGVTYEVAATFFEDYDRAFPGIVKYIRARTNEAKRQGYIYNCYGRKLTVPRDFAYKAVNYTVQGSAADLMKRAMIKCDRYLMETGLDIHTVLSIHDELVFETKQEHARRRVLLDLKRIMEDHEGAFSIPVPVEFDRAKVRWPEKEDVAWLNAATV